MVPGFTRMAARRKPAVISSRRAGTLGFASCNRSGGAVVKAHFQTFAAYNRWANERLYAAAADLSEAEFVENRGAFFGSMSGTLNHLLVADRIWLRRITGEGPQPTALNEILHPALPELRAARQAEDERIVRTIDGMTEERVAGTLVYRNTAGEPFEQPLALVLAHIFNHQTHHRGQAHTLLSQSGRNPPPLDLLYYLREVG